jgi:hypothetical protein
VGSEGTAAEPAARCAYVEHAAEYLCVEMGRTLEGEGIVHILACAEQGDEVGGRTKGAQKGELEGDAFQDLDRDCEERSSATPESTESVTIEFVSQHGRRVVSTDLNRESFALIYISWERWRWRAVGYGWRGWQCRFARAAVNRVRAVDHSG